MGHLESESSVNAQYWFQMMSLEMVVFMRGLRKTNFEMFVT